MQFHFVHMSTLRVHCIQYSKTYVKRPLLKRPKMVFKTDYRFMQVKSIAEREHSAIV